jgi:putative phosphoribosyl transferase
MTVQETPNPADVLHVSFTNSRGLRLAGQLLTPPSRGPHPVVVFVHATGSGQDSPHDRAVADVLVTAGFGALLFDVTGHGDSDGRAEDRTLDQQVDDLGAAIGAVQALDEADGQRLGVTGAGAGATVALQRAGADPRIRALVLRSAEPAAEPAAPSPNVPTLLLVGERDELGRVASERLAARLLGPSRVEVLPRGEHGLEDPDALHRVASLTASWFAQHLR